MKSKGTKTAILLLALGLAVSGWLALDTETNLRIRLNLFELLGPTSIAAVEPRIAYLGGEGLQETPYATEVLKENDAADKHYLDLTWLRDALFTHAYDETSGRLDLAGPGWRAVVESDGSATVNGEKTDAVLSILVVEDTVFLAYEDLAELTFFDALGIAMRPVGDNGNILFESRYADRALLSLEKGTYVFASPEDAANYQSKRGSYSSFHRLSALWGPTPILEKAAAQEAMVYEGEDGILAVTGSNSIGIVLADAEAIRRVVGEGPSKRRTALDEPVTLVWEAVYGRNPDPLAIPAMPGVDVLSPTWYELAGEDGRVTSKRAEEYVRWAAEQGYELWPLVSNGFDPDRTHAFLHDAEARDRFIETMLEVSNANGYGGINLDFENVYLADKDALSHFVNEFAYAMEKDGRILSMDVTVMGGSDNWSKCYDHPFLGKIVDYLMVMAYDQHWASSPVSGPVASYDWVERHMAELAAVVEPDKLVLGLPLYNRVWRERPSGEVAGAMTVRSSSVGMAALDEFLVSRNAEPFWDEAARQSYAAFFDGDSLVKVWIENAGSLARKAELVDVLGLGGVACWQRSFATDDVWAAVAQ